MAAPDTSEFEKLVATAVAHHEAGRLSDAGAAYQSALALAPGHAGVLHNLGVIAAARGDHAAALGYFDQAIAARPHYVLAHFSRATALRDFGKVDAAIDALTRVCVLDPDHYEANLELAFLWLSQDKRDRALDYFARTYSLRRGGAATATSIKSLGVATRAKLRHDAAQFRFLSRARPRDARFPGLARTYEAVAAEFPEAATRLSAAQRDALGEEFNTAIFVADAPEAPAGAVTSRSDAAAITDTLKSDGVAYFDDLLTERALEGLRRYLVQSTIWHDFTHIDGFVASYLEDGLACPLLLQIASEVRRAFADMLDPHPLTQAWAFKGLEARAAVAAHADDAMFSLNFWVTPTEANLNPHAGGMVVCRTPPPVDWRVRSYDDDRKRAVSFLEQSAASTLSIPYRNNRAVLFRSRLVHASDRPEFDLTYENYRINLTFLFGRNTTRGF